MLRKQQS